MVTPSISTIPNTTVITSQPDNLNTITVATQPGNVNATTPDLVQGNVVSNGVSLQENLASKAGIANQVTMIKENSDDVVTLQLEKLIEICALLTDPKTASIDLLLSLSWGIGALPKEKKFSKKWQTIVSTRQWLLLEDMSRQIAGSDVKIQPFLVEFAKSGAKELQNVLTILNNWEKKEDSSGEPVKLSVVEEFLDKEFDRFVLDQVKCNISIVLKACGRKDAAKWLLEDDDHIKAFFRTVQVIGEAPEIFSKNMRAHLPTLYFNSNGKFLWNTLRNQLHHEKKQRAWGIAKLQPKKWAVLLEEHFINLQKEINNYENNVPQPLNISSKEALETLSTLCDKKPCFAYYRLWNEINNDFSQEPKELKRIFFGLEDMGSPSPEEVWEKYAKNRIKDNVDAETNRLKVFSMLRLGKGIFISDDMIKALAPTSGVLKKEATTAKMIELLKKFEFDKKDEFRASFDTLANKFVFLKVEKDSIVRDSQKNKEIMELMSEKITQSKPFQYSEDFFKNPVDKVWGELLEAYIKLKKYDIDDRIKPMNELLEEIKASWPGCEINKENCAELGNKLRNKSKSDSIAKFKDYIKTFNYVIPKEEREGPLEDLQRFPAAFFVKVTDEKKVQDKLLGDEKKMHRPLNQIQNDCISAIGTLSRIVNQIPCSEDGIRSKVTGKLKEIYTIYHSDVENSIKLKQIKDIFSDLAFKDIETFLEDLKIAGISHTLKTNSVSLNSFCNKVLLSLEKSDSKSDDWALKMKELVSTAKEELCTQFVQSELSDNKRELSLLRDIYEAGLDKNDSDKEEIQAWKKKEKRKWNKKEIVAWEAIEKAKQGQTPEDKALGYVESFESKVKKLGEIYSRILKIEQPGNDLDKKPILLLSAEYDMQEIGALAQLITDRPLIWDQGRVTLSSRHIQFVSLMRKMMAHYPLSLSKETLRWNLEYLAFDTANLLANDKKDVSSYKLVADKPPKRKVVNRKTFEDNQFAIEDHLHRLNLLKKHDVLYPSLSLPHLTYLHPFGELALMVYPDSKIGSKAQFSHHVMKLELILSYELDTTVSVIGNWEETLVNVPSEKNIPKSYLEEVKKHRQESDHWLHSHYAYDLFSGESWTKVVFNSGVEVTRACYDRHQAFKFFLTTLEIPLDEIKLKEFLGRQDLKTQINQILQKELSQTGSPYSESRLFKWVCCLFEQFCPPGVQPADQICFPPSYDDTRPLITMVDKNGYGLKFLPEILEESPGKKLNAYYENLIRIDFFNGRSVLDPEIKITSSELKSLATYAANVLESHKDDILKNLKDEYGLAPPLFRDVKSVSFDDLKLMEAPEVLNEIDPYVQACIEEEVNNLVPKMIDLVSPLISKNIYSKKFCVALLEWMKIDKEIERAAKKYYIKNYLRLTRSYVQMDKRSQEVFNEFYIIEGTDWSRFPFVNCFKKFLDRIYLETCSLNMFGKFNEEFKTFIPEEEEQRYLKLLMEKREQIMVNALQSYQLYHPYSFVFSVNNDMDRTYKKWNALFRMVTKSAVFDALIKNIDEGKKMKQALKDQLKLDFESQYKNPIGKQETTVARSDNDFIYLDNARDYFDGKGMTREANDQCKVFKLSSEFLKDWEESYGEPFKPLAIKNLIVEARDSLTNLINRNYVPSHNFETVPTYSDYWEFVNKQSVKMSALTDIMGLHTTFKAFILNGGKLEEKECYKSSIKNQENISTCLIMNNYIPFFCCENAFSDLSHKLNLQVEIYTQMDKQKEKATNKAASWVISEYENKLNYTKDVIEDTCVKIKETFEKMTKLKFFKMLKLFVAWQHLVKTQSDLSKENQENQALHQLIETDFELASQKIVHLLEKCNIDPGKYFSKILQFSCQKQLK